MESEAGKGRGLLSLGYFVQHTSGHALWVKLQEIVHCTSILPFLLPLPDIFLSCFSHGQSCGSDRYQHHSNRSPVALEGASGHSGELRYCSHSLCRWVSAGLCIRQVGMVGTRAEEQYESEKTKHFISLRENQKFSCFNFIIKPSRYPPNSVNCYQPWALRKLNLKDKERYVTKGNHRQTQHLKDKTLN